MSSESISRHCFSFVVTVKMLIFYSFDITAYKQCSYWGYDNHIPIYDTQWCCQCDLLQFVSVASHVCDEGYQPTATSSE